MPGSCERRCGAHEGAHVSSSTTFDSQKHLAEELLDHMVVLVSESCFSIWGLSILLSIKSTNLHSC